MNEINPLLEAFKRTNYQLIGHGKRDIKVLKEALNDSKSH
jgi:hypothetical protein